MISPQLERLLKQLYETLGGGLGGEQRKAEILAMIQKDPEAFLASILIQSKRDLEGRYSSPVLHMTLDDAAFEKPILEARQLLDAAVTEETTAMTSV